MRRAFKTAVLLAITALAALAMSAPAASGAGKATFPDKLKERYVTVCTKRGFKPAFCECTLGQFEKQMSLRQMVRYVVALEQKRKPSKVIIRKVTQVFGRCAGQAR